MATDLGTLAELEYDEEYEYYYEDINGNETLTYKERTTVPLNDMAKDDNYKYEYYEDEDYDEEDYEYYEYYEDIEPENDNQILQQSTTSNCNPIDESVHFVAERDSIQSQSYYPLSWLMLIF